MITSSDGNAVARVGLGCMGMSEFYGQVDDETSVRSLHAAFDMGYRHFDTADMYGRGHNEKLLARFVRELGSRKDQIVVATKCGIVRKDDGTIAIDSSPQYVREACERSLSRLGVSHIDLYYLHRRSTDVPIEDTMGAFAALTQEGKIRQVGLSEVSAETLRGANAVHPVCAVQSEYSLWSRDVESSMLPSCDELGVDLVAYSPLGRGFLTGAIGNTASLGKTDLRGMLPRFQDGNFEKNKALLDSLQVVASELGVTLSRVALAWVLARSKRIHVIPGARKESRIEENWKSLALSLSDSQLGFLDDAFAPHRIAGERYPSALLKTVNT